MSIIIKFMARYVSTYVCIYIYIVHVHVHMYNNVEDRMLRALYFITKIPSSLPSLNDASLFKKKTPLE